jgi:peroxiredoxin
MIRRQASRVLRLAQRHRGLAFVGMPCLVAALLLGLIWNPASGSVAQGNGVPRYGAAPIPQDRPAPGFSLPRMSGTDPVSLQGLHGDVVVLNFWASWCGACKQEVPALEKLWDGYRGSDVRFVGVDHADEASAARAFTSRAAVTYPIVVDHAGALLAKYGALGLPATYVIDRQGQIRYEAVGSVDTDALRGAIDRVRAGHPATPDESTSAVHLVKLADTPAPDFTLIDQFGARTSLSEFAGHVTLLTFVDSECEDVCTLTAEALQETLQKLGTDVAAVQLLAVNANPDHFQVADVRAWSVKHGMLHRWRYVTGQPTQLQHIWGEYGVTSHYEDGELEHSALVYVIDGSQRERDVLWMSSLQASVDDEAHELAQAVLSLTSHG